jgi:hypothetical protein
LTRRHLLACGAIAFVFYVALDTVSALLYDGYSWSSQTISELSAVGAPTAPLWAWFGPIYTILALSFALGVWFSAGGNRRLRVLGILLFALGVVGLLWPLGPMHRREVLAAGGGTWTDTVHIALSMVTVPLNLLIIAVGAAAFGRGFRIYSILTLAALLLFGALTGVGGARVASNGPTPLLGLWERIVVFGYMAWVAVLALKLMRQPSPPARSARVRRYASTRVPL